MMHIKTFSLPEIEKGRERGRRSNEVPFDKLRVKERWGEGMP
jgi:hypothetical protein